jgi:hypothetical protein
MEIDPIGNVRVWWHHLISVGYDTDMLVWSPKNGL